jgi:hypothetical protein
MQQGNDTGTDIGQGHNAKDGATGALSGTADNDRRFDRGEGHAEHNVDHHRGCGIVT